MQLQLQWLMVYGTWLLTSCPGAVGAPRRRQLAQSTVEYALIGALIVVAASVAVATLGGAVSGVFDGLTNVLRRSSGS